MQPTDEPRERAEADRNPEKKMTQQGIYWLCEQPAQEHHRKAQLLADIDYEVTFFSELESLEVGISAKRVPIIIVSASEDTKSTLESIHALASNPAIQGARLIFSYLKEQHEVLRFVAGQGFRDILQLDWDDHTWLERFEFSTAAQSEIRIVENDLQAASCEAIDTFIPARLVWLNQQSMWLESRLRPEKTTELTLTGAITEKFSTHDELAIAVSDRIQNHLVFRFSEAIVAHWQPNSEFSDSDTHRSFMQLWEQNQGAKPKVFLAVQSPALRNTLLKYLPQSKYDVHTALQKKSVVTEPKFFSPHLVFIEDRICAGEAMVRFQEMVSNIPATSTVVVVGGRDDISSFKNFSSGRRIEAMSRIPKNLADIIDKQLLPVDALETKSSLCHLSSSSELSFCEIKLSGKISAIGEEMIEIHLPVALESFGLIRLNPKKLGTQKNASYYFKVVATRKSDDGGCIIVCRNCNLSESSWEIWRKHYLKSSPRLSVKKRKL